MALLGLGESSFLRWEEWGGHGGGMSVCVFVWVGYHL